ncbi:outer membrane protein U [Vibrio metschnikovii]|uniref:porin n=1 Tax=Vibrio TaxID=662 RepID=UPI0001B9409E|nr:MULTISPECIES: porin [Vibrio]EEX38317.1 outer membrane protein OmpU [Vibrio metschnikovii CIP 69.14]NAW63407.1 porin [Vibrio sp. V31_P5A7T61]NAW79149.1 porin [Vibrio sp. V33_P6A3T137]NAX03216.1 porin [Vibrio sp. V34_P3A8T189]NAX09327.1 porin [Vibrio sp. V40_P2S30T141]
MNKTLIALAVSAAAMTAGVNAGEIYNQDGTSLALGGRAEARLSLKDGKAEDASRVRINVLGKTQINDSLYGLGFYEGEFTTADKGGEVDKGSNDLTNRYAFAGIGGDFGLVTYGKNDGALGVITDFTDIMAYHGNKAAYKLTVADRADNMLTYAGQFDDLAVKASYRFADRVEGVNFGDNNQDGYSLSAIYAFADTGFAVGAGYADQDKADQWMLAASYAINDLYFAGTYVDGQDKSGVNKKDKTGYELAAKYTMQQTVFTTSYNYLESKTSGQKTDEADSIAIDATYFFKPNFRSYISYNFNLLDSDKVGKVNAEDELALGLRYDF